MRSFGLRSSTTVPSLKVTGTASYSTRTLPSGATPGIAESWNWPPYTGSGTTPRRLMVSASAEPAGIDRRTSIDTALTSFNSGGWPRPSLMWQFWQALVLNSGPRPSRAVVVVGAITQGLRKKLLPTAKSRRRLGVRLAEGME